LFSDVTFVNSITDAQLWAKNIIAQSRDQNSNGRLAVFNTLGGLIFDDGISLSW